jgi:hypothetical protein
VRRRLGLSGFPQEYKGPLLWEYLSEHSTPAVDGNFLVMLLANKCIDKDPKLLSKWGSGLELIWQATHNWSDDAGFVVQPKYSDWQDSVKRQGRSLYLNVLKLRAQAIAKKLGLSRAKKSLCLEKLVQRFSMQEHLLKTHENFQVVSQDGILLLCEALCEACSPDNEIEGLSSNEARDRATSFFRRMNQFSKNFKWGQASCPSYLVGP